jgi:hypothetical protein
VPRHARACHHDRPPGDRQAHACCPGSGCRSLPVRGGSRSSTLARPALLGDRTRGRQRLDSASPMRTRSLRSRGRRGGSATVNRMSGRRPAPPQHLHRRSRPPVHVAALSPSDRDARYQVLAHLNRSPAYRAVVVVDRP